MQALVNDGDGPALVPSSDGKPPSPGLRGRAGKTAGTAPTVSALPPPTSRAGPSQRSNSPPADDRARGVDWPPARLGAPLPPPGSPDSEASGRVCVTWAPAPAPRSRDGGGQGEGGRGG